MAHTFCVLLLFGYFVTVVFTTDYGPQIIVPWTEDKIPNVSRIIYRTVPPPSNCPAYLHIAAQMTVPWWEVANNPSYQGEFLVQGTNAILGWWYWMERRNNLGGIFINGIKHCVNLTVVSSGYTTASTIEAANKILNGDYGSFHLYFAPWSSGFTKVVAPLYNAKKAVLLAGYAAATEIYKCGDPINVVEQPYCAQLAPNTRTFPYVFSALPQAEDIYLKVFDLLRINGAETIAGFSCNESFTIALYNGSIKKSLNLGIKVKHTGIVDSMPNASVIEDQVRKLKAADADIVLAATRYTPTCIMFIKELKRQNYFPKALLLSQCADDPLAQASLGVDLSYTLDYVTWHESLSGSAFEDPVTNFFPPTSNQTSSEIFLHEFIARWGCTPDHFSAPVAIVMGYILEEAFRVSAHINKTDDFVYSLSYASSTTFWGTFGFDAFGFDSKKDLISVQVQPDLDFAVVAPLEGTSSRIRYPAPKWEERASQNSPVQLFWIVAAAAAVPILGLIYYFTFAAKLKRDQYKNLYAEYISKVAKIQPKELNISTVIGRGGSSVVYKGMWRKTPVAIKKFSRTLDYADDSFMEHCDFLSEAQIMINLRHPNIVICMGVCVFPDSLAIVTELLELGSLSSILKNENIIIEPKHIQDFALDVCNGMAYLHASNIIHRDLKTKNLLVTKNWAIKVSDFGLSREHAVNQSNTMTACGTGPWIAPEVLREHHYSGASDVYSFAICLWEMCTRKTPFENVPQYQLLVSVATKGMRPEINGVTPECMVPIICQCWNDDPHSRPSFEELVHTIENLQLPVPQRPKPQSAPLKKTFM